MSLRRTQDHEPGLESPTYVPAMATPLPSAVGDLRFLTTPWRYSTSCREARVKTFIEPFRIRMIEPIRMSTRADRERWVREAGYNPFLLKADQVLIDLVTDSGTSALSTRQWSAMLGADESFTGSRSFYRFRDAVQQLFGHRHVIPCHQGRAAEHLIARAILAPGDVVLANTHFATTRTNIEETGAECRDLPIREALDPSSPYPFKGNIDVDALARSIAEVGASRVPFVVVTVTDNSRGGQPVSLANLAAARAVCRRHGVPLLLDAARFAENAYLDQAARARHGRRRAARDRPPHVRADRRRSS